MIECLALSPYLSCTQSPLQNFQSAVLKTFPSLQIRTCKQKSICRYIQISHRYSGMVPIVSVHRRRLRMTDFSNRVLFYWPWWTAHALTPSSLKALGPPFMPQFFAAWAGPWAIRAPSWVPGRSLWWDILTQHDHPVVHIADTFWQVPDEAQASLLLFRLLPCTEHFNTNKKVQKLYRL